jgi:hypothetical protein
MRLNIFAVAVKTISNHEIANCDGMYLPMVVVFFSNLFLTKKVSSNSLFD